MPQSFRGLLALSLLILFILFLTGSVPVSLLPFLGEGQGIDGNAKGIGSLSMCCLLNRGAVVWIEDTK